MLVGDLLLAHGKTTLALELAKTNGAFYSDEKMLIDLKNIKAVGRIKNQYLSNDYWKEKYGDKEYHEHSNLAKDIDYEIGLFVQPIMSKQSSYTLDLWDANKFLWHLYEESSRKIRGTSRIFFDNTYPAMSLDTEALASNRLNLLKEFVTKVPAIYFNGTSEMAVKLINEKFC